MRSRLPRGRFPGLIAVAAAGVLAVTVLAGYPVRSSLPEADARPAGQETRPPARIDRPRIMILGDSLTQGSSGDVTWRHDLWRHLRGSDADLVGPHTGLYDNVTGRDGSPAYAAPDFDRAHLAGWDAGLIGQVNQVGRHVVRYRPHYLLVLGGRDDLIRGVGHRAVLERLRDLVIAARVARADLRFVLGRLPRSLLNGQARGTVTEIASFNAALPALAAELSVPESPVTVARADRGFSPTADTWDGAHANRRGEMKIAASFADALADGYALGRPYPRPLRKVELGPRRAPVPAARPLPGGTALRWAAVPGATGYWVWMRAPGGDLVRLNGPVVFDHTEVTGIAGGVTYEFRIQPVKGQDSGARSAGVTVRTAPVPAARSLPEAEFGDLGVRCRARGLGGGRACARR
ncbi:MAG: hypothetical protein GEV11_21330 [Streptosporangiales bacterium]|nr:hypothetical protein [Streptosporangiales bacterium]